MGELLMGDVAGPADADPVTRQCSIASGSRSLFDYLGDSFGLRDVDRVAGCYFCGRRMRARIHRAFEVRIDRTVVLRHYGKARLGFPGRSCLLYTSDAADDLLCVDLGGRR